MVSLSMRLPNVSAINFLSMIPVSISGLGVREGGFVIFFQGILSQEQALALSVLYFLSSVIVSLSGGVLLSIGRDRITTVRPVEDAASAP